MIASQQSIVTTDIDANYSTASILIPSSKGKASNALVCKLVKQAQNGNETNLVLDLISDINLRHQNDRLRPSNLTNNEYHFFKLQASNSFFILTTFEPKAFRIIHVTDAINHILNVTREH
ncbi:unnamed protein product [Rotaria magnacalcarata]|uniref:Uncharacterized protein n=2 Tax=Rotaria magnacalcarata TaxID=392030 RepID=A0A815Z4S0_9BILA|nr:unnamed protein product [Rotaria magnacalcarata]CAF1605860.1 unnamed protein product [Rotaria magnacalcarata]CAF1980840.1 unnamed protein product [Rotaria magnacalcarata]CAF2095423.1 unnamed protein product [Rotaria magnacalcarata]